MPYNLSALSHKELRLISNTTILLSMPFVYFIYKIRISKFYLKNYWISCPEGMLKKIEYKWVLIYPLYHKKKEGKESNDKGKVSQL